MAHKIYIKKYEEGYWLVRYSSLTRGKAYAKGTMIHKLGQPFPTYGLAIAAVQQREQEERLERVMGGSLYE